MKICVLASEKLREILDSYLKELVWDVFYLPCNETSASLAVEFKPDCLLVDEWLQEFDGFELCKKIRELDKEELPILMILRESSTVEDIDVLRFGIDSVVTFEQIKNIRQVIEEKLSLKKSIKKNEYVDGWVELEIDNDMRFVKEIHELVEKLLARSNLNSSLIFKLEYSFKEMLQNAWEHGNHKDINKKIKVSYVLFDDRLIIKIVDEGGGFAVKEVDDPMADPLGVMRKRQQEGKRAGGWGIASVRKLMDELIFSEQGNIVLLVKYLYKDKMSEEESSSDV